MLNVAGPIPSIIFTSEEVEEKLKLENSFYIYSLATEKGKKVKVNFYNFDGVREEKHSFTIGDPYKVDIDIAFAENGNVTLTANNQTTNPY